MQGKPRFVRRENVSDKLQENANLYDEFIRKVFRIFNLEQDVSEKIELLKESYYEICGQEIERNEIFIERLKKVKVEIDMEKSNMVQYFVQALKLLKSANIIDLATYKELVSGGLEDQESEPINYVQRRKELGASKHFINGLLQQKMGLEQRKAKLLKVEEILEKLGKIDYSGLDPSKELKVEFENYGSSENGYGLLSSDFDISITTLNPVDERKFLEFFCKEAKPILNKLLGRDTYNLQKIIHEKIRFPIVKLHLKKGDIFISFTVNNILGVYNSQLLREYAKFDDRCHSLCLLVKIWAKVHKVVSVQRYFLSSYALNLMVINFLQTMKNPILPSLQKESKKEEFIEVQRTTTNHNIEYFKSQIDFVTEPEIINSLKKQYSDNNKLTDIDLLRKFFKFYSQPEKFQKLKLSIKEGQLLPRSTGKEEEFLYSIEDPFDIRHNPGESLKKNSTQAQEFLKRMKLSYDLLRENKIQEVFQFSPL